ncbi:anthranilate phosphoribosyltransferase [Actinoplanes sp. M2I2]|uniref:anthranilate phosphoribosyltransferase n=1 Tax=Actinoplanes sp. M2I2 TaxID=1734444 RepID=UPI0020224E6D|nr:anthranilate phosphoribosyltransferase [Actinoplanes sp. M2I2]
MDANASTPTGRAVESWPALISRLMARHDLGSGATTWIMQQVIRGDAPPVLLAAVLIGLRAKGETAAEIEGFVDALMRAAVPVSVPGPTLDIAGTGGDGTNAVNISTMAAIVVAATGTTVVKHGGRASSSTSAGSADVVERLGIPLDLAAEDLAAVAVEAGVTFLFAPRLHPGMRHAGPVRRELGVPTVFNLLGPLINPADPTHRLVDVADAALLPVLVEVLRARGASGMVVRGDDGLDKISTATTSQVWTMHEGLVRHEIIDPSALGVTPPAAHALRGADADTNTRVVHEMLAGRAGPIRDAVLLNAAAALAATTPSNATVTDRIRLAFGKCAHAVDTGAAGDTLTRWIGAAQARHRHRAA